MPLMAGDVEPGPVLDLVERYWGGWERGADPITRQAYRLNKMTNRWGLIVADEYYAFRDFTEVRP